MCTMELYILVVGEEEVFADIFYSLEEVEEYVVEWGYPVWDVLIKHVDLDKAAVVSTL